MGELFRGNRTAVEEIPAAVYVRLSLVHIPAPLRNDGLELVAVRIDRMHLPHGACQLGFRLAQCDGRIRVIEPHELLAGLYEIRLVRADGDDRAAHLRHDGDQVARDVGIVRILVIAGVHEPIRRRRESDHYEPDRRVDKPSPSSPLHQARDGGGTGVGGIIHLYWILGT